MTETYGRFTRRDVAQRCIDEADSRIADDLVLVSILDIPNALNCYEVDDGMNVQKDATSTPAEPEDQILGTYRTTLRVQVASRIAWKRS